MREKRLELVFPAVVLPKPFGEGLLNGIDGFELRRSFQHPLVFAQSRFSVYCDWKSHPHPIRVTRQGEGVGDCPAVLRPSHRWWPSEPGGGKHPQATLAAGMDHRWGGAGLDDRVGEGPARFIVLEEIVGTSKLRTP